jgi:transposase, IS5 family
MASFFELDLENHLGTDGHLMKISKLLKWYRFSHILKSVHSDFGPEGYDPVQMFKCLLLQSWHSLSDPGLEQSLRVRLDFLQFTGFCVGDKLPDETTFCRFRNKLVQQGKLEKLLGEVNRQLEVHGLKVKNADVAIVDATIISSNARPRKVLEPEGDKNYNTKYSADPDAKWLKKGAKSYFGYRVFARSDAEGFIDKAVARPANMAETKELDAMTNGLKKGTRVNADKGFFSAENKAVLRKKGLKNGLMYKAFRNKPLTNWMRKFNKLISKTRWRIEQCFGTIKRRFSYQKASYFTTEKVDAQFKMKAICLNLLKAINKLEFA